MKAPLFNYKVDRKQAKKVENKIIHNTIKVEPVLDSAFEDTNAYISTTNSLQEQIDELKAQIKRKRIKKITIKL